MVCQKCPKPSPPGCEVLLRPRRGDGVPKIPQTCIPRVGGFLVGFFCAKFWGGKAQQRQPKQAHNRDTQNAKSEGPQPSLPSTYVSRTNKCNNTCFLISRTNKCHLPLI
mmetsp:Transcript_119917/g.208780  ORF Transcript_119917/g.208780 Transcript_119917/m.208780 type:complete len:109 (-) Transcript_119917:1131-1457(-)